MGRAGEVDSRQSASQKPSARTEALRILALAMLREVEALSRASGAAGAGEINLADEVRRFEAEIIRSTLLRTGGRQRRAAKLLGMKVSTLNAKIKRYRIRLADDPHDAAPINAESELHS